MTWLLPKGSKYIQKADKDGFTPLVMNNLTEGHFEIFEEKINRNAIIPKEIIMTMTVEPTAAAFTDQELIDRVRGEKFDMFVAHGLP